MNQTYALLAIAAAISMKEFGDYYRANPSILNGIPTIFAFVWVLVFTGLAVAS